MADKVFRVAVDGPSGAGKSTVAKLIAKRLGIEYIDTGAMYRAFALKMQREGLPAEENEALKELLASTEVDIKDGAILLDGEDVSAYIRTAEISKLASDSSAFPMVREKLVSSQRKMGSEKSVIMDGRDIGTMVFPDAECKIFLTASPETRAMRRYLEYKEKGEDASFEQVLSDINQRDYNDSHRAVSPLRQAEDAVLVDSSALGIEETVDTILGIIGEKNGDDKKI